MSDTKTEARPLTPAEARALDALVAWRHFVRKMERGPFQRAKQTDTAAKLDVARQKLDTAADAVVAEREVKQHG